MYQQNEAVQAENDSRVDSNEPVRWEFGNLLDADARIELREFYGALESSKDCKTILVGFTPPID
jgi:hypothetical protein